MYGCNQVMLIKNVMLLLTGVLLVVVLLGVGIDQLNSGDGGEILPSTDVAVQKGQRELRWIENRLELGFVEARKSGKPLMVVFRCPP